MTERQRILLVDGAHYDRIRSALDTSLDFRKLVDAVELSRPGDQLFLFAGDSKLAPLVEDLTSKGIAVVPLSTLSAPPSIAPRSELLELCTAFADLAAHLDTLARPEG